MRYPVPMRLLLPLLTLAVVACGDGPSADAFRLDGGDDEACVASLATLATGRDSVRAYRATDKLIAEASRRAFARSREATPDQVTPYLLDVCREYDGATLDEILLTLH